MAAIPVTGGLRFNFFGKNGPTSSCSKENIDWDDVKRYYRRYPDNVEVIVFLQCLLDIYGETDLYLIKVFRAELPIEDSVRRIRLTHILRSTGHTVDPDMDL